MYNAYKRIYNLGFACYAVLTILAVIFYKERTIFTDIAFHVFTIVRTNTFAIQNMRFGAVMTQIFPLLTRMLGGSLNSILIIYSFGFSAYYFICYFICGSLLKRYDFALVLFLCNIMFVSDAFYWIQSELPQGIAFMIVCFAYISSKFSGRPGGLAFALLGLGIITAAFFHPLIVFPFFYIVAFLLLRNENVAIRRILYGMGILFLLAIVVKTVVFPNAYDKQSVMGMRNFKVLFPYLNLYSNRQFVLACVTKYYWLPILAMINIAVYSSTRQWLKLFLFLCCSAGFLFLVNVTHPGSDITGFYMESMWLPLAVFVGVPFVFDVLPVLQKKKLAFAFILLIVITGCVRIYASSRPYTTRLNWERRLLNKDLDKKLAIHESRVPVDTLIMTWGTPYEFWLLSTTEYHKTASIIVIDNIPQYEWALGNNKALIVSGAVYPYAELPRKYFLFTDSTTGYSLIK